MPTGTPAPIVNKLDAVFMRLRADPTLAKRPRDNGVEVVTGKPPGEFAVFMKDENGKRAKAIKEVGVVTG